MNDIASQAHPLFHITGEKGWINDPNGLVVFGGCYHVFYQYYPGDVHWGPMHWGHVVSDDLLHWRRLPIALAPGDKGDKDGCFSGSAIEWQGKLWLLYTGFTENGGGDASRQVQCLAVSEDGVRFEKRGVVIGSEQLPTGYAPGDFRDPKVWRHDGQFYCAVAARKVEGRGRVLLYRSEELTHWTFCGDLFGQDSRGTMTECPDYREEMGLLTVCEQFQPPEGTAHLNVHTSRWYTGHIEYGTGRFLPKAEGICDYGFDFYAPQMFSGAPVMIGWLNMWDRTVPSEAHGFAGMLTVPRHVEVRDGRMWQTPVVATTRCVRQETLSGSLSDRAVTGLLKIEAEELRALTLTLRCKGEQRTVLTYQGGEWMLDRSRSGTEIRGVEKDADSLAGIRRMPGEGDRVTLTVVMDRYSMEVFANGRALSATVYPDADADGILLTADAARCVYSREIIC